MQIRADFSEHGESTRGIWKACEAQCDAGKPGLALRREDRVEIGGRLAIGTQ